MRLAVTDLLAPDVPGEADSPYWFPLPPCSGKGCCGSPFFGEPRAPTFRHGGLFAFVRRVKEGVRGVKGGKGEPIRGGALPAQRSFLLSESLRAGHRVFDSKPTQ